MKPCTHCRQPLPEDAVFCPICREPTDGVEDAVKPDIPSAETAVNGPLADNSDTARPTVTFDYDARLRGAGPVPHPAQSPYPGEYPPSGSSCMATESSGYQQPAEETATESRPNNATFHFIQGWPGFIVMGLILVGAITLGANQEYFFNWANLQNVFRSFCVLVPYAIAVAITARCCGPDLSIASIALYTSLLLASGSSFVFALVAGFSCGLVNGVLIRLFRLPALVVTLITGQILMGAVFVASDMEAITLSGGRKVSVLIYLLVFVFTLIAGFIYIYFTPAGMPFHEREKEGRLPLTFLLAYPLAGLLAAFGGILGMLRLSSFVPSTDNLLSIVDIFFFWAAIASSKYLDNRVVPALYAAFSAFVLALLNCAMSASSLSAPVQGYIKATLTLLLLFCVGLARWPFGKNRPTLYNMTE